MRERRLEPEPARVAGPGKGRLSVTVPPANPASASVTSTSSSLRSNLKSALLNATPWAWSGASERTSACRLLWRPPAAAGPSKCPLISIEGGRSNVNAAMALAPPAGSILATPAGSSPESALEVQAPPNPVAGSKSALNEAVALLPSFVASTSNPSHTDWSM